MAIMHFTWKYHKDFHHFSKRSIIQHAKLQHSGQTCFGCVILSIIDTRSVTHWLMLTVRGATLLGSAPLGTSTKFNFPGHFLIHYYFSTLSQKLSKSKPPPPNPLMQKLCNIINIVKSLTLSDFWVIWKLYWVKGFLCAVIWKPEKYFIKNTY